MHVQKFKTDTVKTKFRYYLELLTNENMKLLGSGDEKITKEKYGEKVKVVLNHCSIIN